MYSIKMKCRSVSYRSIGQCHIETQVGVIELLRIGQSHREVPDITVS